MKDAHCIRMGLMIADKPNTQKILNIFDPTIFPTAISFCPLRAATIEVTNSGREVPMATTVSPITRSDIQRSFAMLTAPSTNIFPQTKSPIRPPIMR